MKNYVIESSQQGNQNKMHERRKFSKNSKYLWIYLLFGMDQETSLTRIYGPKELQSLISVWYSFGTLYVIPFYIQHWIDPMNVAGTEKSKQWGLEMWTANELKLKEGTKKSLKQNTFMAVVSTLANCIEWASLESNHRNEKKIEWKGEQRTNIKLDCWLLAGQYNLFTPLYFIVEAILSLSLSPTLSLFLHPFLLLLSAFVWLFTKLQSLLK